MRSFALRLKRKSILKVQCKSCKSIVAIDFECQAVKCGNCDAICLVPNDISEGVVINDFLIIKLLGAGGMGNVYLAHEFSLERMVALKILKDSISENEEVREAFIKEARSVASLNHPNIVQAHKVGFDEGILFFSMEYVEGQTLRDILKSEGQLEESQILDVTFETVTALGYAWEKRQLVHRDIKPENIMISNEDGRTKLMDLGLSCNANDADTDSDRISGTPQYISPEQISGQDIDIRTDFYCLGATMYHLLSGEFPFNGTLQEIVKGHLAETPKSLKKLRPDLSDNTVKIVHRLMQKEPADRYSSAETLLRDLEKARQQLNKQNKSKSRTHINVSSTDVSKRLNTRKTKVQKDKKQKDKTMLVVVFLCLILGGVLAMIYIMSGPGSDSSVPEDTAKTGTDSEQKDNSKQPVVSKPEVMPEKGPAEVIKKDKDVDEVVPEVPAKGVKATLAHNYNFNEINKNPSNPGRGLVKDTLNGASIRLLFFDGDSENGKFKYDTSTKTRALIRSPHLDKLTTIFKNQTKYTLELWLNFDKKSIEYSNELSTIFRKNKITHEVNQTYHLVRVVDLKEKSSKVYFRKAGSSQIFEETFSLNAKLLKESSFMNKDELYFKKLIGFEEFKGEFDHMRIWLGHLTTDDILKMNKAPVN